MDKDKTRQLVVVFSVLAASFISLLLLQIAQHQIMIFLPLL